MIGRGSLLAVLLLGCGPAPRPHFAPCPVTERDCRVATFLALEAERGQLWDPWSQPPRVEIISVAELQRRLFLIRTDRLQWSLWTEPLRRLGVLAPEVDVVDADVVWQTDHTEAIYWSHDKEVSMIDRGLPLDDALATAALTREYTHAAQDREFGQRFEAGRSTTDREIVRQTLLQGEAELYGKLAELRMAGTDPGTFDWEGHFRGLLQGARDETKVSDRPHTLVRRALPHPAGGLLMAQAWLRGRVTAVNRLMLSPPPSFLSIMLALDGQPPPPPPPRLCPAAQLPLHRFDYLDSDRVGAAVFYAYLAKAYGDEAEAWRAALTWRSDQMWSLGDLSNGALVTYWRVQAPGLGATAVGAWLAGQAGPPKLVGDELLFWSGVDESTAELLRQTTACGP